MSSKHFRRFSNRFVGPLVALSAVTFTFAFAGLQMPANAQSFGDAFSSSCEDETSSNGSFEEKTKPQDEFARLLDYSRMMGETPAFSYREHPICDFWRRFHSPVGDSFCPEPELSDFVPLVSCEEPGLTVNAESDPFCGKEITFSVPLSVIPIGRPEITSKVEAFARDTADRRAMVEELLSAGNESLEDNKFTKAQSFYREALRRETDASEREYCFGLLSLAKRDPVSAEKHFQNWSTMTNAAPCVLSGLSKRFEERGYLEQGLYFSKQALTGGDGCYSEKELIKRDIDLMQKNLAGCEGCSNEDSDYFGRVSVERLSRWKDKQLPIKVCITSPPVSCVDFKRNCIEALETWMGALEGRLRYTLVNEKEKADICLNLDDLTKQGDYRGITSYGPSESDWLAESDFLRRADVTVYLLDRFGTVQNEEMILYTCLHEIGHALGITAHSTNNKDVMFYIIRSDAPRLTLSDRDRATIRKLYWGYSARKRVPIAQRATIRSLHWYR